MRILRTKVVGKEFKKFRSTQKNVKKKNKKKNIIYDIIDSID